MRKRKTKRSRELSTGAVPHSGGYSTLLAGDESFILFVPEYLDIDPLLLTENGLVPDDSAEIPELLVPILWPLSLSSLSFSDLSLPDLFRLSKKGNTKTLQSLLDQIWAKWRGWSSSVTVRHISSPKPPKLTDRDKELLKENRNLKLPLLFMPYSAHTGSSLFRDGHLKKSEWDRIRKIAYQKANYRCEACGGRGERHPVECHKMWAFDDRTLTQSLIGFRALCPDCHKITGGLYDTDDYMRDLIELDERSRRNLTYSEHYLKHFARVNSITLTSAKKIVRAVIKEWEVRSDEPWQLDFDHNLIHETLSMRGEQILQTPQIHKSH